MVVRQFMLPSDSLSNMVSLLSLVTHIHRDVSTLEMHTVTQKCDKTGRFSSRRPHVSYLTKGLLIARLRHSNNENTRLMYSYKWS